jgi:hypothetical protein
MVAALVGAWGPVQPGSEQIGAAADVTKGGVSPALGVRSSSGGVDQTDSPASSPFCLTLCPAAGTPVAARFA